MNGLADAVRVLLEKSWAVGVLLLIVGGGVWFAAAHAQPLPKHAAEWAVPAALLGFALVVLSIITTAIEGARSKITGARTRRKKVSEEAEEATANLQTLNPEELSCLADFIAAGVTRATIEHDAILADVCRKGVLRAVRRPDYRHITVEIPDAILALGEEIKEGVSVLRRNGSRI